MINTKTKLKATMNLHYYYLSLEQLFQFESEIIACMKKIIGQDYTL